MLKCNVRPHPRIATPTLVFPSRPRATVVTLCEYITNQLLLSIP
jgi:hypothetical protein